MSKSPFASRLRRPRVWLLATAWLIAVGQLQAGEILRDDFSDPHSGWPNMAATRSQDLGFAVYQHGGGYQLTPVQDNVFGFIAAPRQAKGGNVQIDANLFLYAGVGAGAGGVACRYQDPRNFYAFVFRGDGQMLIGRLQDGELTILAQGAVKQVMAGAVDSDLQVSCDGDRLSFSADGGRLSARDSAFTDGDSGLIVIGEKMAGTSAVFSRFSLGQRD